MTKKNRVKREILRYFFILAGSIIAAFALEIFLVPNNVIDGGITGISIILSYLTGVPLSVYIVVLNIPFLIMGYKQIGKTFVISSTLAILSLSFWLSIFKPIPGLTDDVLLAAVFGGIILGIGVGLIIRNSGSLDGTEMVAIVFTRRSSFSVGEIVMFFNIFILCSAALVFGWDRAMYSLLAYYIAFKVIDVTIEGLDEEKAAIIVSDNPDEIAEAILARLGRGVTFLEGKGGFSKESKTVIYSVITRLEISKLKSIVAEKDEHAFLTISDVFDVMGGKQKKRSIH
ncbi:DUF2179 domain-containing protein [Acetobacterium paludosum]|uniref:DUF2179 domain-containing protein n=1 Tax=Acetobacterium paludosum TaxID=52693 RepID=A0A923HTK0_9FIRM|nr:YitT family protein [Acetobacterium paludosum]MBC3888383.1 DUF2179 domain-containing protein [Acetobacterium paludosum]